MKKCTDTQCRLSMVNSIKVESVVNNIMESILYTIYAEGEAVRIWRQMEYNTEIKSSIEKKLKEEEEVRVQEQRD